MKRRLQIQLVIGLLGLSALTATFAGCSSFRQNQYNADRRLAGQVQTALNSDPLYKYPNVSVTSMRGDVQLSGFINSDAQRSEALRRAQSVPGVLMVTDNMTMNTNAPVVPQ